MLYGQMFFLNDFCLFDGFIIGKVVNSVIKGFLFCKLSSFLAPFPVPTPNSQRILKILNVQYSKGLPATL